MADIHTKIRLAKAFGYNLQAALTTREFRAVNDRNKADGGTDVCHSHDFVDANVYMGAAFEEVIGHELDPASEDDALIWNDAWAIAKAGEFFA